MRPASAACSSRPCGGRRSPPSPSPTPLRPPPSAGRRLLAGGGYMAHLAGSLVLICAAGTNVPLLLLGVVLFGIGFGNATSLPPLVAQSEFAERDMQRVVALIVGISQGIYAF